MTFNFLRRTPVTPPAPVAAPIDPPAAVLRSVDFAGLTADTIVEGRIAVVSRLSDALNAREPIVIDGATTAALGAIDDKRSLDQDAIDPYDLLVVFAGTGSTPTLTHEEVMARRVRKVAHNVSLDISPFRVNGTIHLFSGEDLEVIFGRHSELFLAVTNAEVFLGGVRLGAPGLDTVLVNRHDLRRVEARGYSAD